MTRIGYRSLSLKDSTHAKLVDVANILGKTLPEAIESLATSFLSTHETSERIKAVQEGAH